MAAPSFSVSSESSPTKKNTSNQTHLQPSFHHTQEKKILTKNTLVCFCLFLSFFSGVCIGCCNTSKKRDALVMDKTQYSIVKDLRNATLKVERGPQTYFLGAMEEATLSRASSITLSATQYLKTTNTLSGARHLYHGPAVWYPSDPFEVPGRAEDAITLSNTQYIYTRNEQDGQLQIHKGPRIWVPSSPFDVRISEVTEAISLRSNEYIRIIDNLTGIIRVERGESIVYLQPTEALAPRADGRKSGIETAVNIDAQTAVVVRNNKTGQVSLVTDKGLFFPGNYESIESVQKKIILEDQHTIILKDQAGNYHFKTGSAHVKVPGSMGTDPAPTTLADGTIITSEVELEGEGKKKRKKRQAEVMENTAELDRAFFLPPFWEIVELHWSVGPRKQERKPITVIDQRPHQMLLTFKCRTADSVELDLDCNFYWQILDVPKMITKTQNPTGDICFHAKAVISQAVSKLTLDKFLHSFNMIISNAMLSSDDTFYQDRGLMIHSAEMRGLHCTDPTTEQVLQEIIKETTHRLNRLQKQTSDNEVSVLSMKGAIEAETLKGELLQIRQGHRKIEKTSEGESEALQIAAFFEKFGGGTHNLNTSTALEIWHALRQRDSVQALAAGTAQLFVAPADVNLNLGTPLGPPRGSKLK